MGTGENRFRFKISRFIPLISFQPCGGKDHSHDIIPKPKPFKCHVSSALSSCGITVRSKPEVSSSSDDDDEPDRTGSPLHLNSTDCFTQWVAKEKYWQVVEMTEKPRRKIYNSSADEYDDDDFVFPLPPPPSSENEPNRRVKKPRRRRLRTGRRLGSVRVSTSSLESGLFSDTLDDESETLVSSSRSFSTDSSSPRRRNKKKSGDRPRLSLASAPARLSVFQRMIPCRVEGKVRESFAVVKRSEDPYEDFKRSMMEMIVEKQIFDDEDLEQLLHCFLSLNSKDHHGDIVRAFVEIWEALFCASSSRRVSSGSQI